MDRIIGQYTGSEKGPLLIAVGGLHGNEHAGVEGIKRLLFLLNREEIINPGFVFKGEFIGIAGNKMALENKVRFIDKDLNRIWGTVGNQESAEEYGQMETITAIIEQSITTYSHTQVVLLDLHTTSAPRGIFAVPTDLEGSLFFAESLHCPVIINMMDELKGTMVGYYAGRIIGGSTISSLAFESGQHDDPLSVTMSVAALVNCLRSIGCVHEDDVEGKHDDVLKAYANGLPSKCRIIYKHHIQDASKYQMLPGFEGFQKITAGQLLAYDDGVEVRAPMDGRILMPLYQQKGNEGFFIVDEG